MIELIKNVVYLIAAGLIAMLLLVKYRHIFTWKRGESLDAFLKRTRTEQAEKKALVVQAHQTMFGSFGTTAHAHLVVCVCMFIYAMALTKPVIGMIMSAYLLLGFFVSRRAANKNKPSEYDRLPHSDRLWFRLYFAWTWPLCFFA